MARWNALAAALTTAFAVTLGARGASAYCRSTTCDTPTNFGSCSGAPLDCEPLAWKRPCIGWNIQKDASAKVPYDVTEAALTQAFGTWQAANCGGGRTPGLIIQDLGSVSCADIEYNSKAGNANVIIYRDDGWPHEGGDHNIALTTVTYDVNSGEIFDADIEVNSNQFDLTWTDTSVRYDLVSIFTHEAGHFLGLSHSSDAEATMYRHYDQGTTSFRDLALDDQKAICAVYPPNDTDPSTCNPIPRHGFSPECAALQNEGSCSAAPAPSSSPAQGRGAPTLPLAALTALALRRALRSLLRLRGRSARRPTRTRPRS